MVACSEAGFVTDHWKGPTPVVTTTETTNRIELEISTSVATWTTTYTVSVPRMPLLPEECTDSSQRCEYCNDVHSNQRHDSL